MMMSPPQHQQYQQQQAFFPGPPMSNNNNHNGNGGGGGGGGNGMPLHLPQHGIPIYVDSRTGQILHVSSPPPQNHNQHTHQQWQQMAGLVPPSYFSPNAVGQPPQWSTQYHPVHPQQQQHQQQHFSAGMEGLPGSMAPPHPPQMMAPPPPPHQHQHPHQQQSMHFLDPHSMHHNTMMMNDGAQPSPLPMENPPSPRKMPPKRKRGPKMAAAAKTTETMSQRTARADQGYTFEYVLYNYK
jgi:hypothetical protein